MYNDIGPRWFFLAKDSETKSRRTSWKSEQDVGSEYRYTPGVALHEDRPGTDQMIGCAKDGRNPISEQPTNLSEMTRPGKIHSVRGHSPYNTAGVHVTEIPEDGYQHTKWSDWLVDNHQRNPEPDQSEKWENYKVQVNIYLKWNQEMHTWEALDEISHRVQGTIR